MCKMTVLKVLATIGQIYLKLIVDLKCIGKLQLRKCLLALLHLSHQSIYLQSNWKISHFSTTCWYNTKEELVRSDIRHIQNKYLQYNENVHGQYNIENV